MRIGRRPPPKLPRLRIILATHPYQPQAPVNRLSVLLRFLCLALVVVGSACSSEECPIDPETNEYCDEDITGF